jgi:rhamnosyltransferase
VERTVDPALKGPRSPVARFRRAVAWRVRGLWLRLRAGLTWRLRNLSWRVRSALRWRLSGLRRRAGQALRLGLRVVAGVPRALGWLYLAAYCAVALLHARWRRGAEIAVPAPSAAVGGRRPRVLIVTPYSIYPPDHGGGVRLYNLVRRLAESCDLYLLIFSRQGEDPSQRRALEPFARRVVFHRWQPSFRRGFWALRPPGAELFASERVAARIRDLILTHGLDVVQLEYAELGHYAAGVRGARVVLTEHDVAFRQHASRRRMAFHRTFPEGKAFGSSFGDLMRLLRYELRVCRRADQLHMMSAADARHLAPFQPDGARRMRVVPNGVDTAFYRAPAEPPPREGVLYVGNFQNLPNVDALEYFLLDIWPLVRLRRPEARLTVAGANPSKRVLRFDGHDGVEVVGSVPDLRPYYHRHRLMVAPIRAGSGTRLKILEAFAAGLPVVSTILGAEGIDCRNGRHLLIADQPAAFADAVGRLLDDGALCARLAAEAEALAAERYDWENAAVAALACYRELIADAPQAATAPAGSAARGAAEAGAAAPERSDTVTKSPRPRAAPEIAASVVIPTRHGGARLLEALEAIHSQRFAGRFEVVLVDSGSSEEELRAMAAYPVRIESIDPARFNHGLTRDHGAELTRGRVLVFLNQDAVPGDRRWLERLTEPLLGIAGRRAAVQGGIREVPDLAERFYWDSCGERFYFTRESRRWLRAHGGIGFSTVNAALRRDLWRRFPFGWAPIMEDKKWQAEVIEAGYRIVARPRAFVYHTHDYDLPALLRRCGSEGYGWRLLGERYRLIDALRDGLSPRVYADLARGLDGRRIRSAAEFFFPLLRPLALYHGNRWAGGVRL